MCFLINIVQRKKSELVKIICRESITLMMHVSVMEFIIKKKHVQIQH